MSSKHRLLQLYYRMLAKLGDWDKLASPSNAAAAAAAAASALTVRTAASEASDSSF